MAGLAERVVRAHGGRERWSEIAEVMACVSMGGWEFVSRLLPRPLRDIDVAASTREPALALAGYAGPGTVGRFTRERVWIEDEGGRILHQRACPGPVCRSLRRWLSWDELDVLNYVGLLLWQALNLPFLLLREDVEVEELPFHPRAGGRWQRLSVRYPEQLPMLAQEQVLYVDSAGLLRQLDFGSSPYGGVLPGVSCACDAYETISGLVYATRQTFYPRLLSGQLWRMTPLIWIELDDFSVVTQSRSRPGAASILGS